MRRLSTKWFKKWAKKALLNRRDLMDAIGALERGQGAIDLGGRLYKMRLKRAHGGKSSGFRTIILFKADDRAIFLYGFGKNEKENIDKSELRYLRKLGRDLLSLSPLGLERAISKRVLFDLEEPE